MDGSELDPQTTLIHAGRGERGPGAASSVPPVFSSTFVLGGEITYGRYGNPIWSALEETIGALEGGRCLVFASGMAAVTAVLETLPMGASVAAPKDAYLGTRGVLGERSETGRLAARLVDITDTDETLAACESGGMLWIESPTNPMVGIADIRALAVGAHAAGALVVVDNTFATPLAQRPLELGADVVVHSLTKYLSGHSDVVLGAVVTRDDGLYDRLLHERSSTGAIAGPMEAFLALRGLRTLGVRFDRQQRNAMELARRLEEHPAVTRVRYPGLPGDPGHSLATEQMNGYGAIVSFELENEGAAESVCEKVRLIAHMTSLGGVETSIERRAVWAGEESIPASLLRMSVGCENVEDLWGDLSSALASSRP